MSYVSFGFRLPGSLGRMMVFFLFHSREPSLGLQLLFFSTCEFPSRIAKLPLHCSGQEDNHLFRDKQSGTLLKPTDSTISSWRRNHRRPDNQSIRKYALNISEKRRLRFVQSPSGGHMMYVLEKGAFLGIECIS